MFVYLSGGSTGVYFLLGLEPLSGHGAVSSASMSSNSPYLLCSFMRSSDPFCCLFLLDLLLLGDFDGGVLLNVVCVVMEFVGGL
jgi:hypothetical protein